MSDIDIIIGKDEKIPYGWCSTISLTSLVEFLIKEHQRLKPRNWEKVVSVTINKHGLTLNYQIRS